MLLCKKGRARRMYGSDPVFQICLASGLHIEGWGKKKKTYLELFYHKVFSKAAGWALMSKTQEVPSLHKNCLI